MNSGETRSSRPSNPASPRRDLQELVRTRSGERGSPKRGRVMGLRHIAAGVAQARNLAFERGVLSPKRVAARLSENP